MIAFGLNFRGLGPVISAGMVLGSGGRVGAGVADSALMAGVLVEVAGLGVDMAFAFDLAAAFGLFLPTAGVSAGVSEAS